MDSSTLFSYSKMKLYRFFQIFFLLNLALGSLFQILFTPYNDLILTSIGRFIIVFYFFNILSSLCLMYLLFFFTPGVWRMLQIFFAFQIFSQIVFSFFYLSYTIPNKILVFTGIFQAIYSITFSILWYLYFSHRKLIFFSQFTILLNFSADPKSFTTRSCPCCKRTIDLEEKTCPRCHKEIPPILPKGFHLPPLKKDFVAEDVMSCPNCGKTMSTSIPRCCFCGNMIENI